MLKRTRPMPMSAVTTAPIGDTTATPASPQSQDLTEARQEMQIWTAYVLNPYLRPFALKASVHEGRATLRGTVADDSTKDLAHAIALGVPGVLSVDSRIDVVPQFVPPPDSGDFAFGDLVDDATTASAVRSKLGWSRYANGMRAEVVCSRGQVIIRGWITTAAGRDAVSRLARGTRGVHAVINELEIQPGVVTVLDVNLADSWITLKVKSTLLYSSRVTARDIHVETLGGIVSLSGHLAGDAERTRAIGLAGDVRGVKSVDSTRLSSS